MPQLKLHGAFQLIMTVAIHTDCKVPESGVSGKLWPNKRTFRTLLVVSCLYVLQRHHKCSY